MDPIAEVYTGAGRLISIIVRIARWIRYLSYWRFLVITTLKPSARD